MRPRPLLMAALLLATSVVTASAAGKPRLAVLTDIGGDPDDQQSMIRLMVYANEFDIEMLMATAIRKRHTPEGPSTRPHLIARIVDAYGAVLPNLRRHAQGWPTAERLRGLILSGNPQYGRAFVGDSHDSAGSWALIERIDAGSGERPLNITLWGGQTDLAQALWRVRNDRGAAGLTEFVRRFRAFDIADQDVLADWMRREFPGMHYILTRLDKGPPRRDGTFRGMYTTGDESLTSRAWVDENILSRGSLGALYPTKTWTRPNPHGCLKEGDTPAWFFFLPAGGNDPADPTKPGWGGRYHRAADGWFVDLPESSGVDPRHTISRWRPDFQRDFTQRMRWCLPEAP